MKWWIWSIFVSGEVWFYGEVWFSGEPRKRGRDPVREREREEAGGRRGEAKPCLAGRGCRRRRWVAGRWEELELRRACVAAAVVGEQRRGGARARERRGIRATSGGRREGRRRRGVTGGRNSGGGSSTGARAERANGGDGAGSRGPDPGPAGRAVVGGERG